MTDISEFFPSKFLKAADATPPITVTIQRVSWEKMKDQDGKEEDKPVIYFTNNEKGMVMNRTNANTLTAMFGADTDKWTGQQVILGTEMVTAFGATKPALRFKREEVVFDRATLLERYQKLFDQAVELEVPDIDTYVLAPDATDQSILELGKELKGKVTAAKAF